MSEFLLGYSWWRLPTNYSEHGKSMDLLYYTVFWITMFIMVGVFAAMVYFMWKYRYSKDRKKAVYSHGNTRLELVWTLIPAVILIGIALWTKQAWDQFRYSPAAPGEELTKILVIGQQFKWNTVYPHNAERAAKLAAMTPEDLKARRAPVPSADASKKIGRYLVFPKPTDIEWPVQDPLDDSPIDFESIYKAKGPAFLPPDEAMKAINSYLDSKNPLGKDFRDPDGLDDDFADALNRTVFVPKGKVVEISLASKDVLHDFFLPNFRVKLDAVPGLRGLIYFKPTHSSAEIEAASRKNYKLDGPGGLIELLGKSGHENYTLFIDPNASLPAGVKQEQTDSGKRYYKETLEAKKTTAARTTAMLKETPTPELKLAVNEEPALPDGVTIQDKKYVREVDGKKEDVATEGEVLTAEKVKAMRDLGFKHFSIYTASKETIAYEGPFSTQMVEDLKKAGFTEVGGYVPQVWDVVCEELCGAGHHTMSGTLVVLEQDAYRKKFEPMPAAAPVAAATAENAKKAVALNP